MKNKIIALYTINVSNNTCEKVVDFDSIKHIQLSNNNKTIICVDNTLYILKEIKYGLGSPRHKNDVVGLVVMEVE